MKNVTGILISVAMVASLIGCGGSSKNTESTPPSSENEEDNKNQE